MLPDPQNTTAQPTDQTSGHSEAGCQYTFLTDAHLSIHAKPGNGRFLSKRVQYKVPLGRLSI
jgi:hypothetical protein